MLTSVLRTGPARFDMVGQSLPKYIFDTDEQISQGLAKLLFNYGLSRMEDAGFSMVATWEAEIYTMDAEERPSDRSYCVRFKNNQYGYIELIGILTKSGWPSLDHGFAIGQDSQ